MEKLYKILHKKLDKKVEKNSEYKQMKQRIQKVLKADGIEIKERDAFHIYRQEIIAKGIVNKKAIENAYFEGHVKMNDYYDNLDFKEKQRMMNYEISECCKNLISFSSGDETIYIPFFDEKLNRIYSSEIVLFDLKQYHRIVHQYNDLFQENYYGMKAFQSSFSSLNVIGEYKVMATLYDSITHRLFFMNQNDMMDYITLTMDDDDTLQKLSLAYFYNDKNLLINTLLESGNISEKLAKKLSKY